MSELSNNDILKALIPATLALIGTLIVVFFGYRQWKKQYENTRYGEYLKDKQTAYKELWEKLEEVHLKLRTEYIEKPDFNNLLLDVNSYILKKQLFLEKDDQALVNQYLKTVYELTEAIKIHGDDETREEMESSMIISYRVTEEAKTINNLLRKTAEIRNSIITRFRKVISGNLAE